MALTPREEQMFSGALTTTVRPLGSGVLVHSEVRLILCAHVRTVTTPGTLDLALWGADAYRNLIAIPGAALPQITAAGDYLLYVGPGLPTIPGAYLPAILPAVVQVAATVGGGGNFDCDVSLVLSSGG